MKKLTLTVCLVLGLVIMAAPALAGPWNVNDTIKYSLSNDVGNPFNGGSGGLFTITDQNTGAVINTFCLELNEFINNGDHIASISGSAVKGGRFGGNPDPISSSTDWLYAQYATGSTTYNNAKALQVAFWILEEEMTQSEASTYYNANNPGLMTIVDQYLTDAGGHTTGSYGTQVLNLKDTNGVDAQSELINVPEPGILILLGIAMSAIGAASWRLRKL